MTDHETTIYTARRVITMNPAQPFAEAVACRDGRILGVGSLSDLQGWGDATLDETFTDHVILPGFVEAHAHVMAGAMWQYCYVGYFDRVDPNGLRWPGCRSIDEVLERLADAALDMADASEHLIAWGLDPIYFPEERLLAHHLDSVSAERPIFVFHASAHLATVNTAMMRRCDITSQTPTPGVARYGDGSPNGELQEPAAMMLARDAFRALTASIRLPEAKWGSAYEARNAGHTLIADLGTTRLSDERQVIAWREATDDPTFPVRVAVAVSSLSGGTSDAAELAGLAVRLKDQSTDKLHFGVIKLVLDGSPQGFTARISWPHYYKAPDGHPGNGLWLIPPEQMPEIVSAFHEAGLTVHCHCNGDEAAEVFIDAVEQALERYPRWDHRHTVQHSQFTTPAQYKRMAALGMCANIFSNHLYYWGDQHRTQTVGPERAAGMDACGTALRSGVSFSVHSDAPITPLGHLHTAWCAVMRQTASGHVLGPNERISVRDALAAITIDAAFQLKLDHLVGSLEAGKFADFAVLEQDPLEVEPEDLASIGVWGTVLGGVPFPAAQPA